MRTHHPASWPSGVSGSSPTGGGRWLTLPLLVGLGLAAACASSPGRPAQSAEPPQRRSPAHSAESAERAGPSARADAAPESPAPPAPELERLAQSVRALEDEGADPSHHRLLRALYDAADAVEALEPERAGTAAELRMAAERIETGGAESRDHADALRTGLVATLERLRERRARDAHESSAAAQEGEREQGDERKAETAPAISGADARDPASVDADALDAALADLAGHVAALDPKQPLLEQRRVVRDSFRALGDALFLAAGHEAPFGARAPSPRSVAEVMDQARADVLALGRADLSNIRDLTSRAMYSIADVVEVLGGRERVARQVLDIRAEAERLRRDDSGPFARAGWVERGLETALDALEELELCREPLVASWTEAARRAAALLPERGALPFQHAAMQDAFRATLDALGVAVLDRDTCQSSAGQSARTSR